VTGDSTWHRVLACVEAALERKAYDLTVLHTGDLTSVADYFVICSGRSDRQVQAIADAVEARLRRDGTRPLAIEGRDLSHWVLLDYGDVLVHVFHPPTREFYDLERLWSRAPRVSLPEPFQTQARRQLTGTEGE
jgi:ribosome-associated protein